jgi:myo-inositol catabolism protein IolS
MNYRRIGLTDIQVSTVSLGCWTLGGDAERGAAGWFAPEEKEAIYAIQYALEKGVNHFDNADVYGMGRSERILGDALEGKNKDAVIASKVGWHKGGFEHAYKKENILTQFEQSLKNLKRDYLDIYYFHNCDFGEDDRYLEEGLKTFQALKKEGKIRAIGLSGYSADDFDRLIPKIGPDCVQSWANILHPEFIDPGKETALLLKERDISFVAFNPLSRGLLTGKFSAENPPVIDENDIRATMEEFTPEYLEGFYPKMERLKKAFGDETQDIVRAAIQFILYHEAAACAIPGFRSRKQVEINIKTAEKPLTEDEFNTIKEIFA